MIAKGGASLLQQEAVQALKEYLLPVATVITPNVPEAEVLTGMEIHNVEDSKEAAKVLHELGAKYVLMKGGHAEYQGNEVIDFSLMEKNLLSLEASEFLQSKRMEVGVHLLQRLQQDLRKDTQFKMLFKKQNDLLV